jgi:hypothetical protein
MPGVEMLSHTHPYKENNIPLLQKILGKKEAVLPRHRWIGSDVWVHRSTILPECNYIANGVMIGIGSVVTKPIKLPYSVWAGSPAKMIGIRDPKAKHVLSHKFQKGSWLIDMQTGFQGRVESIDPTDQGSFSYFLVSRTNESKWIPEDQLEDLTGFEILQDAKWWKHFRAEQKRPIQDIRRWIEKGCAESAEKRLTLRPRLKQIEIQT